MFIINFFKKIYYKLRFYYDVFRFMRNSRLSDKEIKILEENGFLQDKCIYK